MIFRERDPKRRRPSRSDEDRLRITVIGCVAAYFVGSTLGAASRLPIKTPSPDVPEYDTTARTGHSTKHANIHIPAYGLRNILDFQVPENGKFNSIYLSKTVRHTIHEYRRAIAEEDDPCLALATDINAPSVPVYVDVQGEPRELELTYNDNTGVIQGETDMDLPRGVDATTHQFYGFFKGKRYNLSAVVSAADPIGEPGYVNQLALEIPEGVLAPKAPDFCSD